jgi:hypothetical protein
MWTTLREQLAGGRVLKVGLLQGTAPVPYSEVLRRWQSDADFRLFFIGLLSDAPFTAFCWETPPITEASAHRPFEFVLLDSPHLAGQADPQAFAEHFGLAGALPEAVAFPNLGRDAMLVVPRPTGPHTAYGHLAVFVRSAPESQQHALWALVGKTMAERLGSSPVWLSTAGAGVPWVHVRLDSKPKYYGFRPYRDAE